MKINLLSLKAIFIKSTSIILILSLLLSLSEYAFALESSLSISSIASSSANVPNLSISSSVISTKSTGSISSLSASSSTPTQKLSIASQPTKLQISTASTGSIATLASSTPTQKLSIASQPTKLQINTPTIGSIASSSSTQKLSISQPTKLQISTASTGSIATLASSQQTPQLKISQQPTKLQINTPTIGSIASTSTPTQKLSISQPTKLQINTPTIGSIASTSTPTQKLSINPGNSNTLLSGLTIGNSKKENRLSIASISKQKGQLQISPKAGNNIAKIIADNGGKIAKLSLTTSNKVDNPNIATTLKTAENKLSELSIASLANEKVSQPKNKLSIASLTNGTNSMTISQISIPKSEISKLKVSDTLSANKINSKFSIAKLSENIGIKYDAKQDNTLTTASVGGGVGIFAHAASSGRIGKPITTPKLELDQLVAIHLTDTFPENGIIKTTGNYKTSLSSIGGKKAVVPRETIHFSLNGPVNAHMGGDWTKKRIAIVVPLEDIKENVVNLYSVDTFTFGNVKLPTSATILVKESGHSLIGNPGKAKIVVVPNNVPIQESVIEEIKRKGYTVASVGANYWTRVEAENPIYSADDIGDIRYNTMHWTDEFTRLSEELGKSTGLHDLTPYSNVADYAVDAYRLLNLEGYEANPKGVINSLAENMLEIYDDIDLSIPEQRRAYERMERVVNGLIKNVENKFGVRLDPELKKQLEEIAPGSDLRKARIAGFRPTGTKALVPVEKANLPVEKTKNPIVLSKMQPAENPKIGLIPKGNPQITSTGVISNIGGKVQNTLSSEALQVGSKTSTGAFSGGEVSVAKNMLSKTGIIKTTTPKVPIGTLVGKFFGVVGWVDMAAPIVTFKGQEWQQPTKAEKELEARLKYDPKFRKAYINSLINREKEGQNARIEAYAFKELTDEEIDLMVKDPMKFIEKVKADMEKENTEK
ncbi:MAG: hypothetical protein QW802_04915 [Candidatus Altiarchaeota archaeon]